MFDIHVSGQGKALIWDADAVYQLRKQYRIVGALFGTLAKLPQQNIYLSLPLSLLPEEASLLVKMGVGRLVYTESGSIDEGKLKEYQEAEQDWVKLESQRRNKEANERKQRALESLAEKPLVVEVKEGILPLIRLHTSNSSLPWSLDKPGQDVWNWPNNSQQSRRDMAFTDLWNRGYYISSGSKFGGDYLLYSGDPLRFHSQFVASVIDPTEVFPMLEIITAGRLGTVVKKNHLLCGPREEADKDEPVIYLSVEWTGWN